MQRIPLLLICLVLLPQPGDAQGPSSECLIEPSEVVDLASQVAGVLSSVRVDRGGVVSAGDLVGEINSDVEKAGLAIARQRAESDSTLRSRRATADYEQNRLLRHQNLQEKRIISEQQYEETLTASELAALEVEIAVDQKKLHDLELTQARAIIARRRITSPIDGIVVNRNLSPGEFAADDETIVTIATFDPLYIELFLPLSEFSRISVGDEAWVVTGEPLNIRRRARVIIKDQVLDAATGTFGVRLMLPNPEGQIPAGLRCTIEW